MTQHCTITGTMLVPVHYIVCTLNFYIFSEVTEWIVLTGNVSCLLLSKTIVVKINSF